VLLPPDVSKAFEGAARANNHTTFSFATAAVAVALHLVTNRSDIVIGSQFAGRDDADSEGIVGPLVNTVVLRFPVSAERSFSACADLVRDTVLEAIQHQHLPFEEVERIVRGERAGESRPLFNINFTLQRSNIASASAGVRPTG
jgi:non-ribosomal peptide synthetase component F